MTPRDINNERALELPENLPKWKKCKVSFSSSLGPACDRCMIIEPAPPERFPEIGSKYSGMTAWPSHDSNRDLKPYITKALFKHNLRESEEQNNVI